MHDALTIGIPVLAILFGILWNQKGLRDLRDDMTARFDSTDACIDRVQSDVSGRLDRMQADLSQFYRTLGQHDVKLEALEKSRKQPKLRLSA